MKIRPLLLLSALLISALPAVQAASPKIDPKALELLKSMSTTLSSAKAFTYRSESVIEAPSRTGQFITLFSNAKVAVQRPNKISACLTGEAPNFCFLYDGKTAAAYARGTKTYSQSPAPATIDAMLPALENETGINFVAAPFILSNPYAVLTSNLQSAIVVGPSKVDGVACEHLAFRAPGVNWEIWIESGSTPLPRRLAVTFTDKPNFPRTLVEFSNWNLHPWLCQSCFVFHKPADAHEIPFRSIFKPKGR
ncbi:DUF2092 domain-containing protein [soil metagenome]